MSIPRELQGEVVVTVPTTAKVLKIGINQAYAGVRDGSIPSLRIGANRILVPVVPLLRMLGIDASGSEIDGTAPQVDVSGEPALEQAQAPAA